MQLDEKKREFLLAVLTKWIRTAQHKSGGIEYKEFESVIAKLRHAFMCIPEGRGLLTPMNKILRKNHHSCTCTATRSSFMASRIAGRCYERPRRGRQNARN
jgi:hypothetical protein